jgi:hypothetical protein
MWYVTRRNVFLRKWSKGKWQFLSVHLVWIHTRRVWSFEWIFSNEGVFWTLKKLKILVWFNFKLHPVFFYSLNWLWQGWFLILLVTSPCCECNTRHLSNYNSDNNVSSDSPQIKINCTFFIIWLLILANNTT